MITRVVGLGAGGHARVMLEILERQAGIQVVGLLSATPGEAGSEVHGVHVLGDDSMLASLVTQGVSSAFIAMGSTGDTSRRQDLYQRAVAAGMTLIPVIDRTAIISPRAQFGAGVTIMAGVIVNAGTRAGDNVILNTGALIEHDVVLGDHVHVAPGAILGGNVSVGHGAHIGLGAVVRQGQRIGARVIVGAGAVVVDDVQDGAVVAGVPARPISR